MEPDQIVQSGIRVLQQKIGGLLKGLDPRKYGGDEAEFERLRALVGATSSEDPVTGSLNAALAQWLTGEGLLQTPYIAAQGVCVGRDGQVHVQTGSNGQLWVGGHTVTVVSGSVLL